MPINPPDLPPGSLHPLPGGGELFARRGGEHHVGLPVLLVHGWMATADLNFLHLFRPLGATHRFIAPDLRGHGRSHLPDGFTLEAAADDLGGLLDSIGWDRVVVVGYSMGAAIAQLLAARRPGRVAGLVLGASEVAHGARVRERLRLRAGGALGAFQRSSAGRWTAQRVVDKAVAQHAEADVLRPWLVSELERGHPGLLRAAGRALGRFDATSLAIDVPTAMIVTTRDRLVKPERQVGLAELRRARRIDIDADHDAPQARPDLFVPAVLAGLAALAEAGPAPAPVAAGS